MSGEAFIPTSLETIAFFVFRWVKKRILRTFSPQDIPVDVRQRIDISQITARSRVSITMSAVGIIVAFSYFLSFRPNQRSVLLDFGFLSVFTIYGVLAVRCRNWLKNTDKPRYYVGVMRQFIGIQSALGASWAIIMISAVHLGDADQRAMVDALSIALISTTMVSGPAKYAFAFWTPVTAGSFATLLSDPAHFYLPVFIALICYSFLSVYSIISMHLKMIDRELNVFEIERHSETIELLLKDFQEGSGSFLWETNAEFCISSFSDQTGLPGSETIRLARTNFFEFLRSLNCKSDSGFERKPLDALLQITLPMEHGRPFKDAVLEISAAMGSRWWSISGKPIHDTAGVFLGYRGLCADVTERELYKQRLEISANCDYLTKIYNRAYFNRILERVCQNGSQMNAALLCLDLDHFKPVNDTFGHAVGDDLLVAVAKRITSCVRSEDYVFRLGGDEFAVMLVDGGVEMASAVADRIIKKLSQPFTIQTNQIRVGTSIGIALVSEDRNTPDIVQSDADAALYGSKLQGRGTFVIFDEHSNPQFEFEQVLQVELSNALARGQFGLLFEPVVDLLTQKIVAAETLLSWRHPVYGMIPPGKFIPLLERSGQIGSVGLFVITQSIRVAALVPVQIFITINLSPFQLDDLGLPLKILTLLTDFHVDPTRIEFKITASGLLENDLQKLTVLSDVRKIGCKISLDDFGAGASSLRLLDAFQFDGLKIDAAFLRDLTQDSKRLLILISMIQLGKNLGLTVIGKGIDTQAQADRLVPLGCWLGQGGFFSPKLSQEELLDRLTARDRVLISF
jgi:diguanylate cyclase (GGDEF)-like protein